MLILALTYSLAFGSGAVLGKNLAAMGITSENALRNHQKSLTLILGAIAPSIGLLIILDKFHLTPLLPRIFPSMLLIYLAGYFNEMIIGISCFCLGLLICLQLSGKRSRQKISQLLVAIAAIACSLSILFFYLQPVRALVGAPKIENGIIVWQTTPYTCAPASIATLGRYTKKHPELTELDVVKLTKTNRFGTTTLSEIRAMKQLGLNPKYMHNLTIEDLIAIDRPALLHVKEKNQTRQGVRFSHAVAFLVIDAEKELVVIGNPLYGMQIKTFRDLEQYWYGEAILVNESN